MTEANIVDFTEKRAEKLHMTNHLVTTNTLNQLILVNFFDREAPEVGRAQSQERIPGILNHFGTVDEIIGISTPDVELLISRKILDEALDLIRTIPVARYSVDRSNEDSYARRTKQLEALETLNCDFVKQGGVISEDFDSKVRSTKTMLLIRMYQ